MPIRQTKDIETLYADVADYDLVVVPDVSLASAISHRLERPHFGTFASTPRRLAAGRTERAEERTAFLEVVDRTDHDWKAVANAVENVLGCWEQTGDRKAILEYDTYVNETTRDVIEILGAADTTTRRLAEYTIDADRSVAVVAPEQLTPLEGHILPPTYDAVDLFTEESFALPDFHVFDSATDVVAALIETVSRESAAHVAVVVERGSAYGSLVRAGLESADVPFFGGPGFVDDPDHRAFLRLLRLGFRGDGTTVGEAEPVLRQIGVDVAVAHREKRLDGVEADWAAWLSRFWDRLHSRTFGEALSAYEEQTGRSLDRFGEELQALGLAERVVTSAGVDSLAYYLQTYDVPVDREREGVVLADPTSAAYVDRPAVFYLGMGQGWTQKPPKRPWVDPERQFDQACWGFEVCLQSGAEQYYLVQDVSGGEPVTPCLYFDALLDAEFERFSDLQSVEHDPRPPADGDGFERESLDIETDSVETDPAGMDPVESDPAETDTVETDPVETISQSRLNSYVNCPRDFFFGQLLDSPDREHFAVGNLFHDYAEFHVANPAVAADESVETLVEAMLEETDSFRRPVEEPLSRRTYRIGLETIRAFLDERGPTDDDFLTPASGWDENFFADYFDEPVDSPLTERWFEDAGLGIKGVIDLVLGPTHLLDYKSGHRKRATQVVAGAATDPPDDTPNFQAALYLCYYRTKRPKEPLEFTFFHFLETVEDVVAGDADLEDALTTVSYEPFTFDEYVGSRAAYDELLDGYADCEATVADLGYPAYSEVMDRRSFPETTDRESLRNSDFADDFTAAVDERTGEDVDAAKGCDQAIRLLNGVRRRTFFREDLDAVEAFVDERLAELNRRRAGEERFPVEGLAGEPNYRRVDHRDLLLEGDR